MLKEKILKPIVQWFNGEPSNPLDEVGKNIALRTFTLAFGAYIFLMLVKFLLIGKIPDINNYLNEWYIFFGLLVFVWIRMGLRDGGDVKTWKYIAIVTIFFITTVNGLSSLGYLDSYEGWLIAIGATTCWAAIIGGIIYLRKILYARSIGQYIKD